MDVDMPRLSEIETVRRIRAQPSIASLPIVMLTSSAAYHDVQHSQQDGANGYVQKPLAIDDFLDVASALGHFWLDLHL